MKTRMDISFGSYSTMSGSAFPNGPEEYIGDVSMSSSILECNSDGSHV